MNPCRILIVEDEAIIALDIQERIASMGYELAGRAASGEQALAMAGQQRPDLVLMDIRLRGEMDGIAAAQEFRARFHVPVIFLTAYSEDEMVERAKLAEPFGYILKPFEDRELKSAIEIALYKHRSEEEIRRVNRLYDVLSQVNQAVVRAHTREELLPAVCRLVVERGAMDLAWIGRLDRESFRIVPMAQFGEQAEILREAEFYCDDRPEGQANPGKTAREGRPFVCNNCGGGVCLYPADEAPARFGLKSCASFPLRFQGEVWGTLNLCAAEPLFFQEREIELLQEVAMDISFALDKIEGYDRQERTEQTLRESEERLKSLFERARDAILIADAETGTILDANLEAERLLGRPKTEIIGLHFSRLHPPEHAAKNLTSFRGHARGGGATLIETEILRPDGVRVPVEVSAGPVRLADGRQVVQGFFRDINDRKQAEEKWREEKEKAQKYLDVAGVMFLVLDSDQTVRVINKKGCEILGYGEEEIVGKKWAENFLPERDRERLGERFDRLIGGEIEPAEYYENPVLSRSGEERMIAWHNARLTDEAGHIICMIGSGEDITERKRTEKALRQSEEKARELAHENAIMAEIGQIIGSTLDIDQVYEGFAETAKKIIPFDRVVINMIDIEKGLVRNVYIAGEAVQDRVIAKVYPLHGSGNAEMVRTGSTLLIQTEDFAEYQDRFPMLASTFQAGFRSILNVPLFAKGRVIGGLLLRSRQPHAYTEKDVRIAEKIAIQIAGAIANVQLFQERKRIADELLKSEERYRRLVELSPLMIMVHQAKKYVYVNPAAVKVLGASRPEELLGKSIYEVIHPDYWEIVEGRMGKLAKGEVAPPIAEKFICLDQKNVDVEVTNVQVLYQDEPMILVIARDITEQKKAEEEKLVLQEQLQQAQRMEAIGTLAGGIAHDFNNILAAILGYAELAGLDMAKGSKAKNNMQQSIQAVLRAKDLVQQILTFSRQGRQERRPVDIRPIIKEGLKFLRASLPSTIEIRQGIEEDLGMIEADPTQIHQVLMNLCTNAAHAMDEKGGVLQVSLSRVDMDGQSSAAFGGIDPGSYLRLRVSDTGHGIPPEVLKKIFEPYFTTKGVGKGTGLGLAVVHGIVKSYGGGIAVSSEMGKGSTFDVYFPRIEAVNLSPASPKVEPLPLGGHERVLFVDDESTIVEIGQKTLEFLGYEVVAKTNSLEALELFRSKPDEFDLVITDMTMPNLTGDKFARELIRIRPGIPIILCTGFSENMTEDRAKALGIREFVMKPLIIKELAQAMQRALDPKRKKKGC